MCNSLLALALFLVGASLQAHAQQPASDSPANRALVRLPALAVCRPEGLGEDVLCGRLEVPEDYSDPAGRRISLNVVVVPALAPRPEPTPWVEQVGSPGGASTRAARLYTGPFSFLRQDRDILLVDQRGTGGSNGLYCDEFAGSVSTWLLERWPPEAVRACRDRLARTADLGQYSSANAAADLDAVRAWLGYPQLDLFGFSYGSRAALVYMRRYPARVRSAILWGVVAPDFQRPLHYGRDGQRALDLLLADCAAETACAAAFPDVAAELRQVLARLDERPVPAAFVHPIRGDSVRTYITRSNFALALWDFLLSPTSAHRIPLVIHHAARGDFAPFLDLAAPSGPSAERYYDGMHLSVTCPEETQHVDPDRIAEAYAGTFLGTERISAHRRACAVWKLEAAPVAELEPVAVDVPTLLISGQMDPVTPPSWGEEVARHLPRSRHVVARHLAHDDGGVTNAECLDDVLLAFVTNPEPSTLDTRCVETMGPLPFALVP